MNAAVMPAAISVKAPVWNAASRTCPRVRQFLVYFAKRNERLANVTQSPVGRRCVPSLSLVDIRSHSKGQSGEPLSKRCRSSSLSAVCAKLQNRLNQ